MSNNPKPEQRALDAMTEYNRADEQQVANLRGRLDPWTGRDYQKEWHLSRKCTCYGTRQYPPGHPAHCIHSGEGAT